MTGGSPLQGSGGGRMGRGAIPGARKGSTQATNPPPSDRPGAAPRTRALWVAEGLSWISWFRRFGAGRFGFGDFLLTVRGRTGTGRGGPKPGGRVGEARKGCICSASPHDPPLPSRRVKPPRPNLSPLPSVRRGSRANRDGAGGGLGRQVKGAFVELHPRIPSSVWTRQTPRPKPKSVWRGASG